MATQAAFDLQQHSRKAKARPVMQSALLDSAAFAPSDGPSLAPSNFGRVANDGAARVGLRAGGGYGERSGSKLKAIGVAVVLHTVALAMLASASYTVTKRDAPSVLQTFDMTPEPPPPPPPPPPPQPTVQAVAPLVSPIVAPKVDIPVPTENKAQTSLAGDVTPKGDPKADAQPKGAPEGELAKVNVPADTKVSLVKKSQPAYPYNAKKAKLTGTVWLKVQIGSDGSVLSVAVATSSGHDILDKAAIEEVRRKWRFKPATRAGNAVTESATFPITFNLD